MRQFILVAMVSCMGSVWGCGPPPKTSAMPVQESGQQAGTGASASDHQNGVARVIANRLDMSMVLIPAGQFRMGSAEPGRFGDYSRCEGPKHLVRITQSFRISRTEVTLKQFSRFVQAAGYTTDAERARTGCNGLDPASGRVVKRQECLWKSPGFEQNENHPVVCVSWNDAREFCKWLSATTRDLYRLPTEAEWEYCCRAGTETFFSTGDTMESLRLAGNCGDESLQARCPSLNSTAAWNDGFAFTAPVASFQPNRFGLYDMHGNVGEWCLDWFDSEFYARSPVDDPRGPMSARSWRAVRGGSWYNNPVSCRSSGRHDGVPTEASTTNGFRVVMEISKQLKKQTSFREIGE